MSQYVIEGTWEEIERRKAELIGFQLRVIVKPRVTIPRAAKPVKVETVLGKYAFVPGGADEFAKQKQIEIEREDKPRG